MQFFEKVNKTDLSVAKLIRKKTKQIRINSKKNECQS